jgi:hypothetical protein
MPTYTTEQRQDLRQYMGYSLLFASSNAIFENVLNTIQASVNGPDAFNQTITLLGLLQNIDQQRINNSNLGLATEVSAEVKFDAYRNDLFLKSLGRNYIKQLSIIFSMKPAADYFGRSQVDLSGNIYPTSYDL